MSEEPTDSTQVKAQIRQEWDQLAAGWRAWWEIFERSAQAVSDHLVALAQIEAGQHILDIATGIGEPAVTAARRVGLTGHVVAVDQAPQMLAIARERAAALGLHNIEFRELDAERLDLLEERFDALLCRWGLMLLPHLVSALQRMRQRLLPGGRFAAAVWPAPPKVPVMSLPMAVINQYIQIPPPPPGYHGPFSLADREALERAFAQAGWSSVHSEAFLVNAEFASAGDYVRFMQAISPLNALLRKLGVEQQQHIWQAIRETVQERYGRADGTIFIQNETTCLLARP
jgi:SAM-dependent methyltransferase